MKKISDIKTEKSYTDWKIIIDDNDSIMIKDLITDQHIIIEIDDFSDFSYLMHFIQSQIDIFLEQKT